MVFRKNREACESEAGRQVQRLQTERWRFDFFKLDG